MAQCDQPFTFSEADREHTLSDMPSVLGGQSGETSGDWRQLQFLKKKRARLYLHAVALADYCRANKIPRGLRINKPPTAFTEDEEFRRKWVGILNKCSSDLMLLIIQTSKQECEKIQTEVDAFEQTLKNSCPPAAFDNQMEKLESSVRTSENKLKELKIKKFKRDLRDYSQGRVYRWWSKPTIPKKRVSWADPIESFSDLDTTEGEDTGTTAADKGRGYQDRMKRRKARGKFSQQGPPGRERRRTWY